jgi:hypothetical protein
LQHFHIRDLIGWSHSRVMKFFVLIRPCKMIYPLLLCLRDPLNINASSTLRLHLDTSQSLLRNWPLLNIHPLYLQMLDIPVWSLIPVPGLIAVPGTIPAIKT